MDAFNIVMIVLLGIIVFYVGMFSIIYYRKDKKKRIQKYIEMEVRKYELSRKKSRKKSK